MRHKKSFNHLGRKAAHRNAMLSNMATSLIMHKRINTTVAKAKALKSYVEPLITKSKVDSTHSRRVVFSYLQSKESVSELFREVAVKVANRPGGYTRILKTGKRIGDNAEMCIIELVDYNQTYTQAKAETKKSTRRRRSGGGKKKTEADTTTNEVDATLQQNVVEDKNVEQTEKKTTENVDKAEKGEEKKAEKKTDSSEKKAPEKKAVKAEKKAEEKTDDKEDK